MNNMFTWPQGQDDAIASPYLWVFFATTIPLTALVYLCWIMWFKHSQKKFKKDHEVAVRNFEQELKMRVRSATGTW